MIEANLASLDERVSVESCDAYPIEEDNYDCEAVECYEDWVCLYMCDYFDNIELAMANVDGLDLGDEEGNDYGADYADDYNEEEHYHQEGHRLFFSRDEVFNHKCSM